MELEATNPQAGVVPEAETVSNDQVEAEAVASAEEPEDDAEEVEFEGERFIAPKKVKEALMRQSDYTQKTQKLSETEKALLSEKETVSKYAASVKENLKIYAQIETLDGELERYSKVNWDALTDDDPVFAQKAERDYRFKRDARDQLAQQLLTKENERSIAQQREAAKREEDGRAVLTRDIKAYSPELESKLREYAASSGVPGGKEVKLTQFPHETKILHKAYLYDQLVKKQQAAPKVEQPEAKPITKVGGGKSTSGPTEFRVGMQGAEYDKWRAKQGKK